MNKKNDVEVIINKKRYILCGYESDEYLQKIASYLNNKYQDLREQEYFNALDTDMRNVLVNINVADDYFKAIEQIKQMEREKESDDGDLFDMKHELIQAKADLESLQTELEQLKSDYQDAQKTIVRLETELETK